MYPRLFIFLITILAASPEPSSEIPVLLEIGNSRESFLSEGRLVAEAADGSDDLREIEVKIPSEVEVRLPAGAWILRLEAEEAWSRELGILVNRPLRETLEVRRLVPVEATTRIASGRLPESLTLRLTQVGEIPIYFDLEVGEKGRAMGAVPEGTWDLRIHSPGFVPIYAWDQKLEPSKALNLGPIDLQRGASISGLVRIEGDADEASPSLDGIEVEAVPATGRPASDESAEGRRQRRARSLVAQTDERGFYQIVGVAPGAYEVTARKKGLTFNSLGPVAVPDERTASWLEDPLIGGPPLQVEVQLRPAHDPYGNPWRVSLSNPKAGRTAASGPTDDLGSWSADQLTPGAHYLNVHSSTGDGKKERWFSKEITLEPGMGPVLVDLPIVHLRGTLTYQDEPLEARFRFSAPGTGRDVVFNSDEQGEFEGFLPDKGRYKVEVSMPASRTTVALPLVEIDPLPGSDEAVVDLEVPGRTLEGQVLWADGRIAVDALVEATPILDPALLEEKEPVVFRTSRARTDEEGRFQIPGLVPGTVSIQASLGSPEGRGSSSPSVLEVVEDLDPPYQRLVLESLRTIQGRVTYRGRLQPGATVQARVQRFSGPMEAGIRPTLTRGDGRFTLELPQGRPFALWVAAPGVGATTAWVSPASDQEIEIAIPEQPGTLFLPLGASQPSGGVSVVLTEGGVVLPHDLLIWRQQNGLSTPSNLLDVPLMAPGVYRLCPFEILSGALEGSPDEVCTSGFLPPGGTLDLASP